MSRVTRIGFLVDGLLSRYQVRLFNAVRRPARRRGAVVLGFPGSYLLGADPERPIFDGSFIFDLVGPECVDGLIVAANVLLSGAGPAKIHAMCQQSGVPAVSIGPLPGIPSVDIDNICGLERVIAHLIEVHRTRNLAFIRGPITNPDSLERERAFRTTLERFGLESDSDHFVTGSFLEASGAAAVRILLDERKLGGKIDGIVAANDQMAAGAIRELRARGIRIPEDIAVVGFDDDEHARSTNPPLTTVAQPICRMGEAAVSLLLDQIEGRTVPAITVLETMPIWRRSCGCHHTTGFLDGADFDVDSAATSVTERCDIFADQFTRTVGFRHARQGIDVALEILESQSNDHLTDSQQRFERIVWDAAEQGIDPLQWEDVLGPLRSTVERRLLADPEQKLDVSIRSQSIHWLLAELSARARLEDQLRTLELANALRVVGSAVVCARNLHALARVLEAGLPGLDVRFCCLCVFTDGTRRTAHVAALYDPAEPKPHNQIHSSEQLWRAIPPTVPPGHFPSATAFSSFPASTVLPPKALLTARIDLLVYPLVFAEDALGYVVVDAPDDVQRAWLLEGLSGHLSSAVYEISRTEQLRAARVLAEQASSAKSAFVAMMSHEVRTPLNAIIGNVDLCLRTELSREQRRYLQRAQASSRSLLGIVDDILDFSRIEAQRVELEHVQFGLEDVIDQVINNCSSDAYRKELELIVDVASNVPSAFIGDSLRLMQVLVNLVNNAVKFSTQGHVALRVTCCDDKESKPVLVRFQVEDTGIGMHADQIVRIFQPFTQADNSITRRYGGTGLGLTICQRLVDLMGGALSVRSEPGRGSTFEFSLPLPANGDAPKPQEPPDCEVFVVESYGPQSDALCRILGQYGFSPNQLSNPSELLTAVGDVLGRTTKGRCLVFMSSQLRDMNPSALCQGVSQIDHTKRVSIVLLAPYSNDELLSRDWQQTGVDVVLAKPVQRSHIVRVLDQRLVRVDATGETVEAFQPLSGRRVLVVQDSDMSRELARDLLSLSGADVVVASDGEEALSISAREKVDLVLMDLNLPKMDGFTAARAMRSQHGNAKVPIIALSASNNRSDRQHCLDAGMDDFIRAPVSAAVLISTVQKWCQGASSGVFPEAKSAPSSAALRATANNSATLEVARALGRLGGNSALYRKLLNRFVQSHAQQEEQLRCALNAADMRLAVSLVHNLVSAAGNIGAVRLQQVAQSFEAALRSGELSFYQAQRVHFETELVEAHEAAKRVISQQDAASRPPSSVRVFDLDERLARLRKLIADHDTAAVEVVDSLGDIFTDDPVGATALRRLAQSVTAYDFESASLQLEKLCQGLSSTSLGALP